MTQILLDFMANAGKPFPVDHLGDGYRCSAELSDGTVLPCVVLRRPEVIVSLAERRVAEEAKGRGVFSRSRNPGREMLTHFLTKGNQVDDFEIKSVGVSKHAMPLELLGQIHGETVMAWTGFVLEMSDQRRFSYGSSFRFEFFDLPQGYEFADVRAVHNHSYVDDDGILQSIHADIERWRSAMVHLTVYREKPFFNCFVNPASA